MLGVVLPATMLSVLLPEASWLATLRWATLIALAWIGAIPMVYPLASIQEFIAHARILSDSRARQLVILRITKRKV